MKAFHVCFDALGHNQQQRRHVCLDARDTIRSKDKKHVLML
jgi:hypothetical protein